MAYGVWRMAYLTSKHASACESPNNFIFIYLPGRLLPLLSLIGGFRMKSISSNPPSSHQGRKQSMFLAARTYFLPMT